MKSPILFMLLIFGIQFGFTQVDPVDHWLYRGDMSLQQSNHENALINYNFHIENNPHDPIGYLHRARLYNAMGRLVDSKMDIKIAQQLNPLSLLYISPELRTKYAAKKSYDFNYEDLDAAFVKSPSRYKDYEKILNELKIGHSQDSMIQLVIKELNNKNLTGAENILNRIEVNDLNKAIILDLQGKVYLKKMDYYKAIKKFTESIQESPSFSIPYHNRSICYKLIGEYEKAEDDLVNAIVLNDDVSLFYFTYAKLNEKTGNDEMAMEYYSKAIEIDKDYEEALINYSQLLKGLGDYEAGIELINRAINNNPLETENRFYMANLHFVYGEFNKAIDEYSSYLKDNPDDHDAMFNIGLSKILIKESEEGCYNISNSLDLQEYEKRRKLYNMFCKDL